MRKQDKKDNQRNFVPAAWVTHSNDQSSSVVPVDFDLLMATTVGVFRHVDVQTQSDTSAT